MKQRIFNLIITDESGSMSSIRQLAINSVNETLQTIRSAQQKHEEQEHFVTLVTFNDDVKIINECDAVDKVAELNEKTYIPDCCTALYDAIGVSVNKLRKSVSEEDKVLVTIVTDGCENASREWSGKAIKSLIEEMREKGWVFAYIGANHDIESAAAAISISNTLKFECNEQGVEVMSKHVHACRSYWYDRVANNEANSEKDNKGFFDKLKDFL